MKKLIGILIAASTCAPFLLATAAPAQAQTSRTIQDDENRIQQAKERGDWQAVEYYQQQLNRDRLQYQRNHGQGENNDSGGHYNNGIQFPNILNNNRDIYRRNEIRRGYYDQYGNWHRTSY